MRTKTKIFVAVSLAFATFSLPTTAWAGTVFNFRGHIAEAYFSHTDPSGCITTDVGLFVLEEAFQNAPEPPTSGPWAVLYVSEFDACTGTQLLLAFSEGSVTDLALQVTGDLNSATLDATVNVFDYVSGASSDVDVNLTWTAIGPLVRDINHSHNQSPGCNFSSHYNGRIRSAEASGTVAHGETNFTPEPSVAGALISEKAGSVWSSCGL